MLAVGQQLKTGCYMTTSLQKKAEYLLRLSEILILLYNNAIFTFDINVTTETVTLLCAGC